MDGESKAPTANARASPTPRLKTIAWCTNWTGSAAGRTPGFLTQIMPVRIVEDPVGDPRWSELVERHPAASIFHSPGWLSALRQTYGYEPFVVTTSPGPTLENGMVVCRVKGWTSRRLVSLPFSDHCDPLGGRIGRPVRDARASWALRRERPAGSRWSCAPERRSTASRLPRAQAGSNRGAEYYLHRLDLRPAARGDLSADASLQHAAGRSPGGARGAHLRDGHVRPIARELLPAAADDAPAARIAAAAARLVSQPGRVPGRPGRDPRCASKDGQPIASHPDAVVQEDDVTTSTAGRTRRITVWAACRSCSGV